MNTKLLMPAVSLIALSCLFMSGCCNNVANTPSFEEILKMKGAGNAFIDEPTAHHMKHSFDVWHRNRQYYMSNGQPGPNCPSQDVTNDDGDIIYTDKNVNDSLSKSVWFTKDVIVYLASLLQDTANKCDGLRIYFASYDSLETDSSKMVTGQFNPHQSTVFLVPTIFENDPDPKDSKHKDDYDIVQRLLLQFKGPTEGSGGAANHGELCPDDCP